MELELEIIRNSKAKVKSILEAAKLKAQEDSKTLLEEAMRDNKEKLESLALQTQSEIKVHTKNFYFERKQTALLGKQKVIDYIFSNVAEKLMALKGDDLLHYVTNQINKNLKAVICDSDFACETAPIIMRTNAYDYQLFASSLADKTAKPSNGFLPLTKLNSIVNMNLLLSEEPLDIKGGFVLETPDFDLNYSIEELIAELLKKHEKDIVNDLFG